MIELTLYIALKIESFQKSIPLQEHASQTLTQRRDFHGLKRIKQRSQWESGAVCWLVLLSITLDGMCIVWVLFA
jgi:hypothetical protein